MIDYSMISGYRAQPLLDTALLVLRQERIHAESPGADPGGVQLLALGGRLAGRLGRYRASARFPVCAGETNGTPVDTRQEVDAVDGAKDRPAVARAVLTAGAIGATDLRAFATGLRVADIAFEAETGGTGIDRFAGVPFVATARNEFAGAVDGSFVAAAVRIAVIDAQAEPGVLDDADAFHTIVRISVRELAIVEGAAIGIGDAADIIHGYAGGGTVAPAALLVRAAAGITTDIAPGRTAELFAVALTGAAGVVAADTHPGIAALGAAFARPGRAGAA